MKITVTKWLTKTSYLGALAATILALGTEKIAAQSYLGLDGGIEGSATIDNTTINTVPQANTWTKANATQTIAAETGTVRSGAKSLRVNNTSGTGRRVWSPNSTVSSTNSSVTIQYYKRVANITNSQEDQPGIINNTEGLSGAYNAFPNVANSWVKVTYNKTAATYTSVAGVILTRVLGSGGDMFIDDVAVYAGAVDVTAPNSATAAVVSNPTGSSLDVSWTAASGGVDNGGYMVVRYATSPNADNDPNTNGIYAVGTTTTNGTGGLTGTIRYVGTGTSFTDNVGLSSATTYYYKIYTFDKAYNYAAEVNANGTTTGGAPTINGTIGAGEYGTHTNGSNQQSSATGTWYMTWDASNLYIGISGTNTAEAAVVYLDKNPITPVNGGTNSDGNLAGYNNYDGSSFANLQFRSDLVVYFKDGYREYRTADGSGGWSTATSGFGNYASASGTREVAIPWSAIGGQPSAFNWFGYVAYSGGGAYASVPTENPGSGAGTIIGASARWDRYYTVSSSSTLPFSRNSYTFTSASDVTSFGPITAYDFTMNSSGRFLSRTGNTAGNWVIAGNLTVGAGTIYLGSGGGSYGTTAVTGNLNLLGGSFDMDQTTAAATITGNLSIASGATLKLSGTAGGDLNLVGNWSNAGTFNASSRQVSFNGTSAQTLTGSSTFDYLKLNNSNGLTLQSSSPVTVNTNFDLTSGKITLGANNLTMGASASFSNQSASNYVVTNSTGALVRNSVGNTATPFPVGLSTAYTPLTVTNTGSSNNLSLVVTSPPSNAVTDATKIVNLEWNLSSGGAGAVGTVVFNWNTPGNVGGSYNATGTGELGNYTAGPNYAITSIGSMSGTTKTVTGIALSSGSNKLVLGNSNAVYAVPPANNECNTATTLTVGNAAVTGDVQNATQSISSILCNGFTGTANDDVWYQFTTSIAGNYTITVVGSASFDAVVDLRSGACTGTNITCADATTSGGTETITFGLSATTTYLVRVYDYNSGYPTTTTFTIAVAAPSPNLTATVSSLSFGNQNIQVPSSSQTFNISATALTPASGNVTVTAPNTDFEVSSNNISFGPTALVAYTGNTISAVPVYVRFNPQTAGAKSGINVTFSGGGLSSPPTIALTGTGVVPAPTVGAASNVACTSFDANWSAVTGATSYRLDVSTSAAFSTMSTIASEGFENTLTLFTGTPAYFSGNSASGDRPATAPVASAGTYSIGVNNGSTTITSNNINTTGYSNNVLSFRLASFSIASVGNGADGSDIVTVEISPNGGTNYYSTVTVAGNSNAFWDYTATGNASTAYDGDANPVAFAPLGGGLRTTDGYSTVTVSGLPAVSNLRIRITMLNNASGERWNIDQLAVTGDLGLYVSGYQDLNVGNVITYPVNTNLSANTTYYYRVRAVNNSIASANSGNANLTTVSGTWTGAVSTAWADPANWCGGGGVPTATTDVIIPNSLTNYPIITTGAQVAKTINIASAASLAINGGSLTMATGDITDNGTLTVGSSGTLNLAGNQVIGTGSVTINGFFETSKAVGFSGTANTAISNTISSLTLGSASTIDYSAGGSQTITAANYGNLSNSGNGNRSLSGTGTIGIAGTFSPGSGNYSISTSTIEFNGSAPQTVPAIAVSSGANYNNLTINNSSGVALGGNVNLKDALTLTSGAFTTTGYTLTLLSTNSATARIAPVTGGSIVGDIVMQRFIAGGATNWINIGMPVSGATLAQWTDDFATSGFVGSTYGPGIFNSVYTYDESIGGLASSANAYIQATNSTNAVDPKKGYFVYMDVSGFTIADKTIDVTGAPLIGSQNLNISYTSAMNPNEDGWNLVNNPYCSAIDWTSPSWSKTNVDDAIYIYDRIADQYVGYLGGFGGFNGGNEIIASSQAFMIHANAATPSLVANEGIKVTANGTFFKQSNNSSQVLRLQLDGLNGTYADETVFRVQTGATSNFDPSYDAYKLYSVNPAAPNIASKVNGVEYVVNSVNDLNSNLDLPVRVNVNTAGDYTINFVGLSNFAGVNCLSFEDKLTNTWVDLHLDSSYTFSSGIDTASAVARFVLHFGAEAIVPQIVPSATTVSFPGSTNVDFVNATTGASAYAWDFGDGSPVDNSVSPSHVYAAVGTYTVLLTATNSAGCSETTQVLITVDDVTSVSSVAADESLLIGKDAKGAFVNYNFKANTKLKVACYNAVGELVGVTSEKAVQNKGRFDIETANLAKGIYTIEVTYGNKKITRKLLF